MAFRNTRLDYFVLIIVTVLFLYSFFFLNLKPAMDSNGSIIRSENNWHNYGDDTVYSINMFSVIAPIIIIYEMVIIFYMPGKKRLREINKRAYIIRFNAMVRDKITDGMDEYREWKKDTVSVDRFAMLMIFIISAIVTFIYFGFFH
jgi:hypothetical protein